MNDLCKCDTCASREEGCVVSLMLTGTNIRGCPDWRPEGSMGLDSEEAVVNLNYFDLGLFRGNELFMMLDDVLPGLPVSVRAYGFEPSSDGYEGCCKRFTGRDGVSIIRLAVGAHDGETKLYHSANRQGDSIFESKVNVDKNDFETVPCVIFSDWLKENVPDLDTSFNVLRFNIEGAEWILLKDLVDSGLISKFHILCGAKTGEDIKKVGEYDGRLDEFMKFMKANDIRVHYFCHTSKGRAKEMRGIVASGLEDFTC